MQWKSKSHQEFTKDFKIYLRVKMGRLTQNNLNKLGHKIAVWVEIMSYHNIFHVTFYKYFRVNENEKWDRQNYKMIPKISRPKYTHSCIIPSPSVVGACECDMISLL